MRRIRIQAGWYRIMLTAVCVATVVSIAACGSSNDDGSSDTGTGSADSPPPSSAAPPSPSAQTDSDCAQGYTQLQFTPPVDGLVACTNANGTVTTIDNTSEDTVWYVAHPSYPYWTPSSDASDSQLDVTTILFRTAMRALDAQGPTIEPDFTITLDTAPAAIQLKQDPGENATWQEVSLLVETAKDKGEDEAATQMENASSPSNAAMIACAKAGYDIGTAAANQDYSATEVGQELYGINGSAGECGKKMDEAANEEKASGEAAHAVTLNSAGIDAEINRDTEFEHAGSTVDDIARDAERGLAELHR